MGKACQLSLAMLFVDQALPTAGVSGITLATGALSRLGMPRPAVASAVVVYLAIYYFAYAFCMTLAAGIAMLHGYLPGWVTAAMLLFMDAYEKKHFPTEKPDPIEMLEFVMENRGLTRADLVAFISSKSKVSEVLAKKRPLSLSMIRKLHRGLGIPADILLAETTAGV